jgi:hypothetical protein
MKLEHLLDHLAGDPTKQVVIAELISADLAHRLSRRYAAMGRDNVAVSPSTSCARSSCSSR